MFNQYEPTVKAVILYLKLLKVKVNNATVSETLQNHPDWPSFLCIADAFNKWHLPNGAGKIAPAEIDEIPLPFMAYTSDSKSPIAIVTEVSGQTITCYSNNYNKAVITEREAFLRTWSGIYLLAEPAEDSGEKDFARNKRRAMIQTVIPLSAFALLIGFSFLLLRKSIGHSVIETAAYFQFLILLAGIGFTFLLLWYEIDKNNLVLQKVCTGLVKGNCEAILTGKQAKVFSWLSWSEVGFFYFMGGSLTLLFADGLVAHSIAPVAWLNILALPYTAFSIYYQARIARQWCLLCLAVQALLIMGAVNIIDHNLLVPSFTPSVFFLIKAALLYLLPALLWYAIKPLVLGMQEAKTTKREYLRIKFNTEIFETLLMKQKSIPVSAEGIGIDLGNPAATHTLIKVCNPYCGPCARMHPKIEKLIEENENIKAKIIFTASSLPEHPAYKPVSHLLAIASQNNEPLTRKALDDWYLVKEKNYETFAAKHSTNGELKMQDKKIDDMFKWCETTGIQHTPTLFINGRQLPDAYSIEDLQYFLLE